MVEQLLMPGEGRCLRRVKRMATVHRLGFNSWPGQPNPLSVKNTNASKVAELCSLQKILAEIAALDAESAKVLARIGGVL